MKTSTSFPPGPISNKVEGFILDTSEDSLSALSNRSASPHINYTGTPPPKLKNGLLFLRSPGPEDFKKRKGWSSSPRNQKSVSSSQESRTELSSTPVKAESERQACEGLHQSEPSPDIDNAISYSPLSEFPPELEINETECRKTLFDEDASEKDSEDSVLLFSNDFSSEDELLSEFIDNLETNNVQAKEHASLNSQLESVTSAPPTNQLAASSTAEKEPSSRSTSAISTCKSSFKSPQSIVLERLRETLQSSESLHLENLNDSNIQSEQPHSSSQVPLSQTSTLQTSQIMPPQKGQSKAGPTSCLKQTDIGVFFGLKPLREKEKTTESELNSTTVPTPGENSRQRQPRRDRQRNSKADAAADTSQGIVDNSVVSDAQGEAGKSRNRGWRGRRWNRVNADGEEQLPRCPFYKKIPGQ